MECEDCGGKCEWYDGGAAHDYAIRVLVCTACGKWQTEDRDEDEDEDEDDS